MGNYFKPVHEINVPDDGTVMANRRKYFRIKLKYPLCSDMKIIGVNGKDIITKPTKVCIEDIGPGGVKFSSHLRLQKYKNVSVLLEFDLIILKQVIVVQGEIVRVVEAGNDIFEYGVKFLIDEDKRGELVKLLNELQIYLKNNIIVTSSNNVCTENKQRCLKMIAQGLDT